MKPMQLCVAGALTLLLCGCTANPPATTSGRPSAADHDTTVVTTWNDAVLAVAEEEDGFLTLKGVRTAAIMHVAMHDAINAIDRRYRPYGEAGTASDADPLAAIAQAGFEIAVNQYPDAQERFGKELGRLLDAVPAGSARDKGVRLGAAAATAILDRREDDHWNSQPEYQWHPMGPGVYAEFSEHSGTPDGFIFGAGWAIASPFMLEGPDHFRSPPPPPIDSEAYALAFDEVKELGRFESISRTADQTHLAMWWKDFVEKSHNRLARALVADSELDLWQATRLFALLNMSIYDAYVSSFDNKYLYNHWRPYTAIRWASNDGNPATAEDADWNNTHGHTYPFPTYPSAHGTVCAAAMTILADSFGDDHAFTMATSEVSSAGPFSPKIAMEPPTRSFDSFSSAAMECAMSRVYLGIHFSYDSVAGNELGTQVGRFAVSNFLQPLK